MLLKEKTTWRKVLDSGVPFASSESESKAIEFSNFLAICIAAMALPFSFLYLATEKYFVFAGSVALMCSSLCIPLLNSRGLTRFSRFWILLSTNLIIFLCVFAYGRESYIHFIYLAGLQTPFLFFSDHRSYSLLRSLISAIWPVLGFVFVQFFMVGGGTLPEAFRIPMQVTSMLVTLSAGILQPYFYTRLNRKYDEIRIQDQNFLKSILDNLPVALFCKDAEDDFRFSLWNRAAEMQWGLSAKDVIGKSDYDFFPKEESDKFRAKDLEVFESGSAQLISEETLTLPTGEVQYLHTKKVPVQNRFLLGISENISALKKSEQDKTIALDALQESYSQLSAIFYGMSEGVLLFDQNLKLIQFNHSAISILEVPGKELIGADSHFFKDLFGEHDFPGERAFQKNTTILGAHSKIQTRSGKTKWLILNATPVVIPKENNPSFVIVTISDFTEQTYLREQNEIARQRMEIASRAMRFGIWDWNLKTNVLVWDDYMYQLYGINKEDFSGAYEAFEKTLLAEDAARIRSELDDAFKNQTDFSSEFRIKRNDGAIRNIRAVARAFYDDGGKIERLVGANWDVTEAYEQQSKLLQASKMSSLGEMSAGIAHEINNPLAIIKGKAQQLKLNLQRGDINKETFEKNLDRIDVTVDRIAKIIKGLRSFARESSNDPFEIVKVKSLFEETLSFCQTRMSNSEVKVEMLVRSDEIKVSCRPAQVSQVLLNLLNNSFDAVTALPEKWIKLECYEDEKDVVITVTDSGKGIPPEIQEKILQPFFTTKGVGKGTGLGLSIATGIIKSHNGSFNIESSSPNTQFVIRMPKIQM